MVEQPSGTVTLVFTDIEGSTRLLHELGEQPYREALAEHRRIVREVFGSFGGYEVDYEGDAFFYAFASAEDATQAVEMTLSRLEPGTIRLRAGIHTGRPGLDPPKYVGVDVHLAARVMAVGWGGQALLTRATRDLIRRPVRNLGEHRLKDFAEPVLLFQLGGQPFPPLKTISNTNLPRSASSFVGRERELGEVVSLLLDARLVTLVGSGGSGKTRLAIEAAGELVGRFRAGVFWVGLAGLAQPSLVLKTVAQTLGLGDDLAQDIAEREMLLLLDNFEQVVEAAPVLAEVLESCPSLRVLVTSRELLRIRGEVAYEVAPLVHVEAVSLFCKRAQVEEGPAVDELCGRLDDLPLAIELAAARTRVLTPLQILSRMEERLDLLKGGRDADPRHATLRATIDWSHSLLTPAEQRLFSRFAVFAGGCTLEAAELVAGGDLDTLQSLVEKSLVRHTADRFWMLEMIREYAAERLVVSGEAEMLKRRHAESVLALAATSGFAHDAATAERHDLVRAELVNVRAALAWAVESDVGLGIQLMESLEMFWVPFDSFEGSRWAEQLLQRMDAEDDRQRAFALKLRGGFLWVIGELDAGFRDYEEAWAIYTALRDEWGLALLGPRMAIHLVTRGSDLTRARALCEASLAAFRRAGFPKGEAEALTILGAVEQAEGRPERELELCLEADRLAKGRLDVVARRVLLRCGRSFPSTRPSRRRHGLHAAIGRLPRCSRRPPCHSHRAC
jgi:predicted ATPase